MKLHEIHGSSVEKAELVLTARIAALRASKDLVIAQELPFSKQQVLRYAEELEEWLLREVPRG